MKNIKNSIGLFCLAAMVTLASCGKENSQSADSGEGAQTTPNDSSDAESRAAMGVGEGNQKTVGGYPSNQSNLNSDSTSKLHDPDTTGTKTKKNK